MQKPSNKHPTHVAPPEIMSLVTAEHTEEVTREVVRKGLPGVITGLYAAGPPSREGWTPRPTGATK